MNGMETPVSSTLLSSSQVEVEHRRQVLRQILLPMVLLLVAILALAVFAVFSSIQGNVNSGLLSSTALILMILPVLLGGIIFLVLIGGGIYLMSKIARLLPIYSDLVYMYLETARYYVRVWSDKAANPVIAIRVGFDSLKGLFARIKSRG